MGRGRALVDGKAVGWRWGEEGGEDGMEWKKESDGWMQK